ncbi:tRNA (adenosine(37)-N6)-threonylcarbamoyltransferase complex ATPase subunit type 1 TsaE [Candidatus Peregrinibacteria bacterium]|nr:tRNA (adenosine(37)-N6)-threonylcarbamoyltransferase complex ATPase subunit type 1 TsaE [Candidatus Peregrinibacteria bacterium]
MISRNLADTAKIAKKISSKVKNGGLICLIGDLGSGKTTFTKALVAEFGIKHFNIKSPTYTYIRQYPHRKHKIYHIDLYRLENFDRLFLEELNEIFENKKNIIVIEWADKLADFLPKKCLKINFEYLDKNSRKITIK